MLRINKGFKKFLFKVEGLSSPLRPVGHSSGHVFMAVYTTLDKLYIASLTVGTCVFVYQDTCSWMLRCEISPATSLTPCDFAVTSQAFHCLATAGTETADLWPLWRHRHHQPGSTYEPRLGAAGLNILFLSVVYRCFPNHVRPTKWSGVATRVWVLNRKTVIWLRNILKWINRSIFVETIKDSGERTESSEKPRDASNYLEMYHS